MSAGIPRIIASYEGEPVSPALPPLLTVLRTEVVRPVADPHAVATALRAVLRYLASPEGRTNANCWAADFFCMEDENWDERRWEHLPASIADILGDMAGALHDSVEHPDVAENFDSTPEQLLARLEQVMSNARPV